MVKLKHLTIKTFFILLLTTGCTKYSEFTKVGERYAIKPVDAGIESIKPVKWRVGPRRKQMVSKGFELRIKFPILEKSHLDELITNTDINSWLVVLRKRSLTSNKSIGRTYIPLVVPGSDKSPFRSRIKQMKTGFMRVFYPAAAISTRYEKLPCPAFDHNLLIEEVVVEVTAESADVLKVSPLNKNRVNQMVQKFQVEPIKINGGENLTGDYEVEIALYNHQTKTTFSNFLRLPQKARVLKEVSRNVKGCENYEIPDPPSESSNKIEEFKFGR